MKKGLLLIPTVLLLAQATSYAAPSNQCIGDTNPPIQFSDNFQTPEKPDPALLAASIGKADDGKLCQGQVYTISRPTKLYRAWNSTNPDSQIGNWWSFAPPTGITSQYRFDNELCYQWSPVDKLTSATFPKGTNVVIGTGQSESCSKYLNYPTSPVKQIYIDTTAKPINIQTESSMMSWQTTAPQPVPQGYRVVLGSPTTGTVCSNDISAMKSDDKYVVPIDFPKSGGRCHVALNKPYNLSFDIDVHLNAGSKLKIENCKGNQCSPKIKTDKVAVYLPAA